ncbi:hypothetical protein [Halobacterium hubeiense]|uniref:hypothetical protein n=1 Tax=Halobacterium hubeiense TaxID=1407499 RepID=UPI003C76379B
MVFEAVSLAALAVVALVAAMRRSRSADAASLDSGYDVAYDPVADPGQAAKQRWRRAVERLPGNGEDADEDGE